MSNQCAVNGCPETPPNPAVPACNIHLCPRCRMGVVVHDDGTLRREVLSSFDRGYCTRCIDTLMMLARLEGL